MVLAVLIALALWSVRWPLFSLVAGVLYIAAHVLLPIVLLVVGCLLLAAGFGFR